ncbi:cytochrome P450 [Radicibacter daui]|uniref:cytochrome P450 n=1 Tax=Radicibacter daui TaxID=3064829 RepID=UPI004046C4BD
MSGIAERQNAGAGEPTPLTAAFHPAPYRYYAALAVNRPFGFDPASGLWIVASADLVEAALADPRLLVRPPAEPVPPTLLGSEAGQFFGRLVRMTDGEAPQALKRAIVATLGALTPEKISVAAARAGRLIGLAGEAPLAARLTRARQVLAPLTVALLLGVPEAALAPLLAEETGPVSGLVAAIAPGADAGGIRAGSEGVALLRQLIAAAGEGALAELVRQAAREGIPADVALDNAIGFLTQSFDATAGLIGAVALALGRLPAAVLADLESAAGRQAFLREVARHDPPIHNTRRFAGEAMDFAGEPLPTGAGLLLLFAAASHDPARYDEPERFDPARDNRWLPTFGSGRHACPGQAIAFAVAEAVLLALLPRRAEVCQLVAGFDAGGGTWLRLANARIALFS